MQTRPPIRNNLFHLNTVVRSFCEESADEFIFNDEDIVEVVDESSFEKESYDSSADERRTTTEPRSYCR